MNNIKVNPTRPIPQTKTSTSGYSNNGSNKNSSNGNHSGSTFRDIFKQALENHS